MEKKVSLVFAAKAFGNTRDFSLQIHRTECPRDGFFSLSTEKGPVPLQGERFQIPRKPDRFLFADRR
jgi:hypothetical protein